MIPSRLLTGSAVSLALVLCAGCTEQTPANPGAPGAASRQPSLQKPQRETRDSDRKPGEDSAASQEPARLVTVIRTELSDNVYLEVVRDDLPIGLGYAGMVGQTLMHAGLLAGQSAAGNIGLNCSTPPQMYYCKSWRGSHRRAVVIRSWVCLRQGYLEHFMSRPFKAHESILATDLDAKAIHTGLLVTGASPGKPVQWINAKGDEDYRPPTGDEIQITLRYEVQGRLMEVPAQRWIRDSKTKKELRHHWVFAGSYFFENPDGAQLPKFYAANDGRIICTANFTSALLDLPIASRPGDPTVGLDWEANTPFIPTRDTTVLVVLEPVKPAGADKK